MKNKIKLLILSFLMVLSCSFLKGQSLMQNIQARNFQKLDGLWQIIVDPMENGFYNHSWQPRKNGFFKDEKPKTPSSLVEYNFDAGEQLQVPGDWNTQLEKLYYYEGTVWYRKKFDHQATAGKRYYLYFEAVNYRAKVYLNGQYIGEHIGGFTPFQFEITDHLSAGNNTIVVKVDNKRDPDG
ncbi:MAG: sugar-binding domain-containing protein, partial [Bacteroidota bacterium]